MIMINYCQRELVVIEITGQGPSTRKKKSEALAEDFSFLVRGPWPVNSITTNYF